MHNFEQYKRDALEFARTVKLFVPELPHTEEELAAGIVEQGVDNFLGAIDDAHLNDFLALIRLHNDHAAAPPAAPDSLSAPPKEGDGTGAAR